jgi:hypothetical protein
MNTAAPPYTLRVEEVLTAFAADPEGGPRSNQVASLRGRYGFNKLAEALFVILTFAGFASLWTAIAADMVASLLVIFNGLRLLTTGRAASDPTSLRDFAASMPATGDSLPPPGPR